MFVIIKITYVLCACILQQSILFMIYSHVKGAAHMTWLREYEYDYYY